MGHQGLPTRLQTSLHRTVRDTYTRRPRPKGQSTDPGASAGNSRGAAEPHQTYTTAKEEARSPDEYTVAREDGGRCLDPTIILTA